ncbi:hypothetical protein [Ammoniphilus sp. 3BR4]|uniref:hypothetical protein n=1 Tax=Ammoniphilus sp. 3BR4 TaxID=3158265 RepID=UPI0034674F69
MSTIDLDYYDLDTEVHIIRHKAGVSLEEARVVARLVSRIRSFCMLEKKQGPSLRASIMIANIAKKTKVPINPMDKQFQLLCLDVLWLPVYRCEQEMDKQTVKEYILQELSKMGKG